MSYEKKMKELLGRLVAMSPEPPPYPEEMTMATEQSSRKPRPALVFVGAAALVAALAVPVILLTTDGNPVGVGTTTTTIAPASSTTTTPATSTTVTTTPPTTSTTVPVSSTWTGVVFLYQTPENSFLGNPALVPVSLELTDASGALAPDDEFTAALAAIGPELPELANPLSNAVPPDVGIVGVTTTANGGGHLLVDMNEAFLSGAGGLLADVTMLNQLVYTLTLDDPEMEVVFTVNGDPIDAYGTEGIDLTGPVGRDDYIEELGLIFLTKPVVTESNGQVAITGMANVFEASLTINVLDGNGAVVYEEFVTATCGTGCWGEFSTTIPAEHIEPGVSSIRVFTYSAEDGSITDAITVPIPGSDVWEITVG